MTQNDLKPDDAAVDIINTTSRQLLTEIMGAQNADNFLGGGLVAVEGQDLMELITAINGLRERAKEQSELILHQRKAIARYQVKELKASNKSEGE